MRDVREERKKRDVMSGDFHLVTPSHLSRWSRSILRDKAEDGYVLRLSKSARWEKGVKVEGRSCSRLGETSPDMFAT